MHVMPAAPNSASAPLLCCICHEKNTTFRYEVVYKQDNKSITILDVKGTNPEELECLTHPQGRNPDSFDSENEYYNFPARHPRHGHLRWPVWTPTNSVTNESQLSITYPDYPIHIPTLTLRRITNLLASRQRRGNSIIRIISVTIMTAEFPFIQVPCVWVKLPLE